MGWASSTDPAWSLRMNSPPWNNVASSAEMGIFILPPKLEISSSSSSFLISPLDQCNWTLDFSVIYKIVLGFKFNQFGP